jgi:heptosyltransferase-2
MWKIRGKYMSILVVGPAWVGDMVMAQTFFKLMRQQYPDTSIDVIAPAATLPLLERMPEIRRAISLPIGHKEFNLKARFKLGLELRKEKYSQAILLTNTWKSALVPFIAGIPQRTSWVGEQRYVLINDIRRLNKEALPLQIQRFAALAFPAPKDLYAFAKQYTLETLPWPKLEVSTEQRAAICERFNFKIQDKKILGLCPGAEFGPAKRWPSEHYAKLAKEYLARGWEVWLFGSPKEKEAADLIMQQTEDRCVNLVGKTRLAEAIDLMACTTAIVTNDSGLMHIAAALGKPVVVVYGSSSPRFTPPLSHQAQILSLGLSCSPCFQRECPLGHLKCLNDLLPEQVITATDLLLS